MSQTFSRTGFATAVVFFSALLLFAVRYEAAYQPTIGIRWAEDVTPERRVELESRFGLQHPARSSSHPTTWTYRLNDASRDRIRRLVDHPSVADTNGILRGSAELEDALGWGDHLRRALPKASTMAFLAGSAIALYLLLRKSPTHGH